ncbi:MAG: HEPN domain-containing protein [Candidatus Woesearchaeota archaeon]|nr:HEPN domain-containing protein [Candidatus Woesearchaeota archaeon]
MKSDSLAWCCKQKKGIKLEDPNEMLCEVYKKKAQSALNMLTAALEKEEIDWITSTAYYARYFAVYAILQKCGIKSEIHDCTITLVNVLAEEQILEKELHTELERAKGMRIETQYYAPTDLDVQQLKDDAAGAREFVLRVEQSIEKITDKHVHAIRTKLSEHI